MGRRVGSAVAALALMFVLAPGGARADHCKPLFVFSGANTPAGFQGTNPGAGGCAYVGSDIDSNYLVPGSTHARVGTTATPVDGAVAVLDGVEVPLTFTAPAAAGGRWNSQVIDLNGAREVKAIVPTATGVTLEVLYRAAA